VRKLLTFSRCSEWKDLNSFSKSLLKRVSSLFLKSTITIKILGFLQRTTRSLLFQKMLLNSSIISDQIIFAGG